jgi:hypothetical protein
MGAGRSFTDLWLAYRLRWKRRRYLFRAWRKAAQLRQVKRGAFGSDAVLAVLTVRNEMLRLPYLVLIQFRYNNLIQD